MLRSPAGKYTSRLCPRPSSVVTTPIFTPFLISENRSRFPPSIHVSDDALRRINRGSPFSTGTSHVSHGSSVPYTIRVPSGENAGLNLNNLSCVSWTGSPDGSIFTYTSPGPRNVLLPLMNVNIRPSGDSSGYTAASVKNVSCSHFCSPFGAVRTRTYK